MPKILFSRRVCAGALALSVLVLAGCASLSPSTPEAAVEKRATAYWKARQAGQIAGGDADAGVDHLDSTLALARR